MSAPSVTNRMSKTPKRIAIVAGAVVLIGVLGLTMLDRALRSIVVQVVTSTSGRELVIGGNFNVDIFPWPPRVRAEQVRFANASWGTEPTMLDIPVLEVAIEPLPLLAGRIVASEVVLTSPNIVLEKSRDGIRRNWILRPEQSGMETSPRIGRMLINGGAFTFRDPTAKTELFLSIATNPAGAKPGAETNFGVNGQFRGLAVSASGTGGEVLALRDTSSPFPIDARFQLAGLRGTIAGMITGLTSLTALDVALTLSGKSLERLAPLVGVPVEVPSFKVAGRLTHHDQHWKLADFHANLGDSDLSGTLEIDLAGKQRTFSGRVTSKFLDVDPLRRVIDPPPRPTPTMASPDGWAKQLRDLNGQLQFEIERVRNAPIPTEAIGGTLQIRNGTATIDPLTMAVAGGKIKSSIRLDATKAPPAAEVSARIQDVTLAGLFPSSSLAHGTGGVGGHAKLTAQGDSLDAMLATSKGSAELMIVGGEIDARLIESLHLDPRAILRFAFGSRSNVRINCAVADLKVQNGTLHSEVFVIDTPNTTAAITGTINIVNRLLDLTIKPVSTGFRLFSAPVPVHITGSFASPQVNVDNSLYLRGGAVILLGLINPLAALLPLVDLGGDKSGQCAALLARAQESAPASSK